MADLAPRIGLVIRHAYLWWNEARAGREEAFKDRPCVIVHGLDDERSWIITTEINRFIWPGPDLRSVPGGGVAYGLLPGAMTRDLVAQVKANANDKALLVVARTD